MKVTVIANNAVFKAGVSYETLKLLARYAPDALVLKDDKGNQMFRIIPGDKCSVSKCGVVYESTASGDAVATVPCATAEEAADKHGIEIAALNRLEAGFGAALEQVNADRAAVMAAIETV